MNKLGQTNLYSCPDCNADLFDVYKEGGRFKVVCVECRSVVELVRRYDATL